MRDKQTYKDRMIEFISADMPRDTRIGIRIKNTLNIRRCSSYVAIAQNCSKVRALQSITSMGVNVLRDVEKRDIDIPSYKELKDIYPYIIFSADPAIHSMVLTKERNEVITFSDFKSKVLWLWEDPATFMNYFSESYGINPSSTSYNSFYLGLDKLITFHKEYSYLGTIPETITAIEEAKTIGIKINDFNISLLELVCKQNSP